MVCELHEVVVREKTHRCLVALLHTHHECLATGEHAFVSIVRPALHMEDSQERAQAYLTLPARLDESVSTIRCAIHSYCFPGSSRGTRLNLLVDLVLFLLTSFS